MLRKSSVGILEIEKRLSGFMGKFVLIFLTVSLVSCAVEKKKTNPLEKLAETQRVVERSEAKLTKMGCKTKDESNENFVLIQMECQEPATLLEIQALWEQLRNYASFLESSASVEVSPTAKGKAKLKRAEALRESEKFKLRIEELSMKKSDFLSCLHDLAEMGFFLDQVPALFKNLSDADELELMREKLDALIAMVKDKDIEKIISLEVLEKVRKNLNSGEEFYQRQQRSIGGNTNP